MFNAAVIIVALIVVASLLQRIRLANYSLDRVEKAHCETLQSLIDVQHDLALLSNLTIEESGQVSFMPLVPDDPTILRFNEYVIDYRSLLSYERGDSDTIVVYNL